MPDTDIPLLDIVVRKRDKLVFKGQATALTSVNPKGTFDILAQHANFITVIKDYVTIHKVDKTEEKFTMKNGVLHSADNKITVYLDILSVPTNPVQGQETKQPTSPLATSK